MYKKFLHLALIIVSTAPFAKAQTDSVFVKAHPSYDSVSKWHRRLFGENFRKEWGTPVKLPLISVTERGLVPLQRGGGHQTRSLRLKDAKGNEWVLRSIEKFPEIILPEAFRETFAADWVRDAMSAQHPYGPLTVPVFSDHMKIPHTNPVIGLVAADKGLGEFEKEFANTLCLLEEREPYGNSDNTFKMLDRLNEDNDNTIDTVAFFRARLLDMFIGDWDRHEDQWRWIDEKKGSGRKYVPVPRDRDQVFYRNEGFFPKIASRKWLAPFLTGFRGDIKRQNYSFFNGRFLNSRLLIGLDHDRWTKLTNEFVAELSEEMMENALKRLPPEVYAMKRDELLQILKKRRVNMPKAMDNYYRFLNHIVDIHISDKSELVEIKDAPNNGILVSIHKISKKGKASEQLFTRTFFASETKELRFFIGKGNDSVVLNNNKNIKVRIVGGEGDKVYNVERSGKKVNIYERETGAVFTGNTGRLRAHLSNDTANLNYIPTNPYGVVKPLIAVGFNLDDGIFLGGGVKIMKPGFRKLPFASIQTITLAHSFSTTAYRIRYKGEWFKAVGKADITMQANIFAPNNTRNFFGRGNETEYIKEGDFRRFYRTRYNVYQANPSLRWHLDSFTTISAGPSIQFYHSDSIENKGRFINNDLSLIKSYDSNSIHQDRLHAGVIVNLIRDKRNNLILPSAGYYFNVAAQWYAGLNDESRDYVQVIPEIAIYKNLSRKSTVVIADRLGGAVTFGKAAFYQSAFLGGHENLFGFRQYRFAGEHMLYNNLELRVKLANFASYILPGQFGMTGFYDVGRVWEKNESSGTWHQGVGGGFYFAPAQMAVIQATAGWSKEGWFPYVILGFRF